ncbi:uncharacterized protein Triagg1_8249 [Trichoderma aggressivum f. europaeum]|uniref:SSCRP protein n=1 Tax=Trichoderma aggressivum f. europaeum TaxID=173218 RepID=A0AAE1IAC8_9HYPO|nr:hypothetical protein Triagg1_8249 [Trichoderma aggressivum f. europaeum]
MAGLLIGLVAVAARTMANKDDDGRQNRNNGYGNGYNNDQYYDNQSNGRSNNYTGGYPSGYNNGSGGNNNYNTPPYAAYPPQMVVGRREERRMSRRMRKAERKARDADMVLSLMNSGSRAGPRSAVPPYSNTMQPQPGNGGVPYMQRGDSSRSQAMYPPAQQGVMEPEGSQWRDVQSRDRPTSRGNLHPASSSEGLPTYEQVVRKSGKS